VFFTDGVEIWKSDGTDAGTIQVTEISGASAAGPAWLTNVSGTIFFQCCAGSGSTDVELWKTDGTAAGTGMLKDIWPGLDPFGNGPNGSYPSYLTNMTGTLLFEAQDDVGKRLWKSDGTEAGTVPVTNVDSRPTDITAMNGTAFFVDSAPDGSLELWKSDGTAAAT